MIFTTNRTTQAQPFSSENIFALAFGLQLRQGLVPTPLVPLETSAAQVIFLTCSVQILGTYLEGGSLFLFAGC